MEEGNIQYWKEVTHDQQNTLHQSQRKENRM